MALEKVLLGDTTAEAIEKINTGIEQINTNADAIEDVKEIAQNAGKIDKVQVNSKEVTATDKVVNIKINGSSSVNVATADDGSVTLSAPTLAKSLTLSMNTTTYELTATLKDVNGNALSTQKVDLPLETMVVGATYDDTTEKIILTLQNGTTTSFSVADLVAGLVSTDNDFMDGEILVADGTGKKAKSSGYSIYENEDVTDFGQLGADTRIPTETRIFRELGRVSPKIWTSGQDFTQHIDSSTGKVTYTSNVVVSQSPYYYVAGVYRKYSGNSGARQVVADAYWAYSDNSGDYSLKIVLDLSSDAAQNGFVVVLLPVDYLY